MILPDGIALKAKNLSHLIAYTLMKNYFPAHRMSIALFCETPGWGGTEVHTIGLIKALLASQHKVTLVYLDKRTEELYSSKLPDVNKLQSAELFREVSVNGRQSWRQAFRTIRAEVGILVKPSFETGTYELDSAIKKNCNRAYCIQHALPQSMPIK
jgi:hypothetical protein